MYASQGEQGGPPAQSQGASSPHSLLPQGRGSIVYGSSGGYQQQDQGSYSIQAYSQVSFVLQALPSHAAVPTVSPVHPVFSHTEAVHACKTTIPQAPAMYNLQGMQQAQRVSSSNSMSSGQASPPRGYSTQQYQVSQDLYTSLLPCMSC